MKLQQIILSASLGIFALSSQGCAKQEQKEYIPQQPKESKKYTGMVAILQPKDDILDEVEIKYK